jgi:hypothetical protein
MAFFDFFAKVSIGGSDEAELYADVRPSANPGECSLFYEAQEFGLDAGRDVSDFVEEEGASGGSLDMA